MGGVCREQDWVPTSTERLMAEQFGGSQNTTVTWPRLTTKNQWLKAFPSGWGVTVPLRKHFQAENYSGSWIWCVVTRGTEDKVVPRTIEKSSQGLLGVLGYNAALLEGPERKTWLGLGWGACKDPGSSHTEHSCSSVCESFPIFLTVGTFCDGMSITDRALQREWTMEQSEQVDWAKLRMSCGAWPEPTC